MRRECRWCLQKLAKVVFGGGVCDEVPFPAGARKGKRARDENWG